MKKEWHIYKKLLLNIDFLGLKDRKTERQRDRKTERQKDKKTERQKDRKTESQKDRTERAMWNEHKPLSNAVTYE